MNHVKNFVALSKYAGERFDLIQAGGGNTSVKLDKQTMLIKASGWTLSELETDRGHVKVNMKKINRILADPLIKQQNKRKKNHYASTLLKRTMIDSDIKPSIETFFHVLLDRYVLHTHPIVVNAITCQSNWDKILAELFPKSILVPYRTPGVELALVLQKKLRQSKQTPHTIFMQNHGLIVHGPNKDMVIKQTEHVLQTIETSLGVTFDIFKQTTKLSKLINQLSDQPSTSGFNPLVAYLSQDIALQKLVKTNKAIIRSKHLCPDSLVYCGFSAIELQNLDDPTKCIVYKEQWRELPKVILYNNNLFFIAPTIKKARQIEEVFKAHLLTTHINKQHLNHLPLDEIAFLSNWDAEKHRKNL